MDDQSKNELEEPLLIVIGDRTDVSREDAVAEVRQGMHPEYKVVTESGIDRIEKNNKFSYAFPKPFGNGDKEV